MRKKKKIELTATEVNLIPCMNLICLLIPFLLLTAAFIQYAVINVASPRFGQVTSDQPPPDEIQLNLTIAITDQGFRIAASGGVLPGIDQGADGATAGPTIPMKDGKYNYEALNRKLQEIKKVYPEETQVIISAEPQIKYEILIKVMDASRTYEGKPLFPDVILSSGIA
jgi:biopolymer transport protein ExbD